jgi:hypothetical protein
MVFIKAILGWLTGGALDRVLSSVDKHVEAQTDREKIKSDIIRESYRTRGDWMRSGGFWLMLIYAVPLGAYFAAVLLYSLLWCQGCVYPQTWTIAALPAPLDEWAWMIVVSIFGVMGVDRFKR